MSCEKNVALRSLVAKVSVFVVFLVSACAGGTSGTDLESDLYGGGTSGTGLGYNDHAAQPGLEETYQERIALIGSLLTADGAPIAATSVQTQNPFFIDEDVTTSHGTFVVRILARQSSPTRLRVFIDQDVVEATLPMLPRNKRRIELEVLLTSDKHLQLKVLK